MSIDAPSTGSLFILDFKTLHGLALAYITDLILILCDICLVYFVCICDCVLFLFCLYCTALCTSFDKCYINVII